MWRIDSQWCIVRYTICLPLEKAAQFFARLLAQEPYTNNLGKQEEIVVSDLQKMQGSGSFCNVAEVCEAKTLRLTLPISQQTHFSDGSVLLEVLEQNILPSQTAQFSTVASKCQQHEDRTHEGSLAWGSDHMLQQSQHRPTPSHTLETGTESQTVHCLIYVVQWLAKDLLYLVDQRV